ncbi:MAG: ATP-binding cassette domain-containing protein, partial [Synergistaceae bacterium]|nr:ATP-binding cassette domain-containing protein [Synergistaceae bacterium]
MGRSVLKTENVTIRFGGLTAVGDFNIEIEEGSISSLIGPNGAGKTTCFNIITGFYTPTEGKVIFMDNDITGMKPHDVCKAGIARTFQNIRLFAGGTVLQNVMTACWVRQKSPWWTAPLMLPGFLREEREIREKSMELLNAVGLVHLSKEIATGLPYGAQRRLEIARALATEPKLLLLDEP